MVRSEADKDGAFAALLQSVKKMKIHLDWIKVMSDYLLDLFLFVSYLLLCSLSPEEEGLHFLTISHVSPVPDCTSVIRAMLRGFRPSC